MVAFLYSRCYLDGLVDGGRYKRGKAIDRPRNSDGTRWDSGECTAHRIEYKPFHKDTPRGPKVYAQP